MPTKTKKKKSTGKKTAPHKAAPGAKRSAKAKAKAKAKPKTKLKAKTTAKAKPKTKVKAATKTKVKAKAKAATRAKKKTTAPKPRVRRDATGHLDPSYAKDLRRLSRENAVEDDDRAFLVGERADDGLAQELGTEFVETVTSGEDEGVELRDADVPEETGGPFVTTDEATEFAREPDPSNPLTATREPFPKT